VSVNPLPYNMSRFCLVIIDIVVENGVIVMKNRVEDLELMYGFLFSFGHTARHLVSAMVTVLVPSVPQKEPMGKNMSENLLRPSSTIVAFNRRESRIVILLENRPLKRYTG
jgi:hypothetical protein